MKFEEDIEKLKDRYDKLFIRWQKTFVEEKTKQQTKKLKAIDHKDTETHMKKLKDKKTRLKRKMKSH